MSASIFVDDSTHSNDQADGSHADPSGRIDGRLRQLEEDVHELRDTVSRFADLMLGEVKEIKQTQTALPFLAPGMVSDLLLSANPAVAQGPPDGRAPAVREKKNWLVSEVLQDAWMAIRMYFDPRYRVRRATQVLIPVLLILFVLNYLFWSSFSVPFLKTVLEKCFDVLLGIVLYKVWYREIRRYREVVANVQAWHKYRTSIHATHGVPLPHDVADPGGITREEVL